MFTIDNLWKIEVLQPLKKAHESNPLDRRLVVVVGANSEVDTGETESLHRWLEKQSYQSIPDEWETDDLDVLQVVHVSKMTLEVLRQDPFGVAPLTPNSWLNRLEQDRFDALLLAQELDDVARQPTRFEIKDQIKPALEAAKLSAFWSEMVTHVQFAKSGQAPKNAEQKRVLAAWDRVAKRRYYDPTAQSGEVLASQPQAQREEVFVATRTYEWGAGWNERHTALRRWIVEQVHTPNDLRVAAQDVFGSTVRLVMDGSMTNIAHTMVNEAIKMNRLDALASYFNYMQQSSSPFNQSGQTVNGVQINTGGGAFIKGNIVTSGDFVGGDVIFGNKIVRR